MAQAVLNQQVVSFMNKYASSLDSLHVSDMYTGYLVDGEESSDVTVIRKTQNRLQMTFKCEIFTCSYSRNPLSQDTLK